MNLPPLAGLAEAAEILGWKKQQVRNYIDRGKFPLPIQYLASGPIWLKSQIDQFKDERVKLQ